jgi:Fe-S cluster assembly protein SufD
MRLRRLAAWDVFESLPMPQRTDEEWRRTDIRSLRLEDFAIAGREGEPSSPLGLEGGTYGGHVFQSNGENADARLADHIREAGVTLSSLESAVHSHPDVVREHFMTRSIRAESGKFAALNGALWSGGVFVHVPRNVEVVMPLRALYSLTSDGSLGLAHTLIILEPGARLTYIEEYASPRLGRRTLSSGLVEIFVGQEARLTLVTLQEYLGDVYDLNTQRALLDRDSVLDWLVIGMGNGVTKSNIDVALQGPGARTQMLGVLWGYEKQHTNYQTLQDHQAPNCSSDLLYKGALTDDAVSVFSGKIRVEKGAQRTDSYQANRTVILSDRAAAFPSPNLEIEANDVRCTHGASVGKVDAEQLFYLMSRGLSLELATKMIVEGFFEEVLEREPGAAIRDNLRDLIRRKIEESRAAECG